MQFGYARVSTLDQNPSMQLDALKRAGCKKILTDEGISGATAKWPALAKILKAVGPGDVLVVWRFDRLGRSLSHVAEIRAWATSCPPYETDRIDRHDDGAGTADLSRDGCARGVRAGADCRTHARGTCRREAARRKTWPQALAYACAGRPRAQAGRRGRTACRCGAYAGCFAGDALSRIRA